MGSKRLESSYADNADNYYQKTFSHNIQFDTENIENKTISKKIIHFKKNTIKFLTFSTQCV